LLRPLLLPPAWLLLLLWWWWPLAQLQRSADAWLLLA
jgi:hypothetical protein